MFWHADLAWFRKWSAVCVVFMVTANQLSGVAAASAAAGR